MAAAATTRTPTIGPLFTRHSFLPRKHTFHPTTTTTTIARMSSRAASQPLFPSYLVTPTELHTALLAQQQQQQQRQQQQREQSRIIPLCASWFLPNDPAQRTGRAVFTAAHIPTARFFDLDAISDTTSPYPHMLPSRATFVAAMRALHVRARDTLVVYDSAELGIFSAPRVAWTLRVMGHEAGRVRVLNNFRRWVEMGLPTVQGEVEVQEEEEEEEDVREEYEVAGGAQQGADGEKVVAFEQMVDLARENLQANGPGSSGVQILDARSEGRWRGTEPEPRPGLSSGHIPGSISVPVPALLDPATKAFLPREELRRVFAARGVDPARPIVSSCGTGVTAAVIDAALTEAGFGEEGRRIYDGSWTEWAQRVGEGEGLIVKENA